ncbi:hydrogenase maturation protease [Jatrophihabitans sp. DSM 45814]
MQRILVAGIGNMFLSDDGFGSEVARRLLAQAYPASPQTEVRTVDYGIRGTHLAFDLLDGWDALILIDAIPSHGAPGTVRLVQVDTENAGAPLFASQFDAHGMDPQSMLAGVTALGGQLPATYVVGCEVSTVEDGIGLSEAVAGSVARGCEVVRELVGHLTSCRALSTSAGPSPAPEVS